MEPVWPGPAPRQVGASGSPAGLPGRFYGGARPTRLSLYGRPAALLLPPFLCLAAPGLSLHTQTQAWCWCLYAFLGRWHRSETDCNVWTLAAAGNCKCKPFLSAANASRKEHQPIIRHFALVLSLSQASRQTSSMVLVPVVISANQPSAMDVKVKVSGLCLCPLSIIYNLSTPTPSSSCLLQAPSSSSNGGLEYVLFEL
jgi:hypothetical protein